MYSNSNTTSTQVQPLAPTQPQALVIAGQFDQLLDMAAKLLRSGMLPHSIKTPEAAAAIIVKGIELGLPPMAALNGINVIKGKPTISPQLMLSLINRSGLLEDLSITTGDNGASVTMKRRGRAPHTATFGPKEAKGLGLMGKDNYKQQAPVMYQWRAVAACARIVFPDVLDGVYTPEEMGAEVNEDGEMQAVQVVEPEVKVVQETPEAPAVDAVEAEVVPAPSPVVPEPKHVDPSKAKHIKEQIKSLVQRLEGRYDPALIRKRWPNWRNSLTQAQAVVNYLTGCFFVQPEPEEETELALGAD